MQQMLGMQSTSQAAFHSLAAQHQARLWPSQRVCWQRRAHAHRRGVSGSSSGGNARGDRSRRAAATTDDRELRELLGQAFLRPEYEEYSDEHVTDLVEAAAGLISVIDDVRPLDPDSFNAFYTIYKAIAAVPAADRVRILEELEPGALYSLWRASLGQYVLDERRKAELFEGHIIWDDLPKRRGQVIAYEGLCEQFKYESPLPPLSSPAAGAATVEGGGRGRSSSGRDPRLTPWLRAAPTAMAAPQERFKQLLFVANRTGLLHSRLVLSNSLGPLSSILSPPVYARVEVGLTLTPKQADAGADAALLYPLDAQLLAQKQAAGVALAAEDLPSKLWPPPSTSPSWSPLSFQARDFMRVAGPGFYVGCAYRRNEKGDLMDEESVYFALVRTSY